MCHHCDSGLDTVAMWEELSQQCGQWHHQPGQGWASATHLSTPSTFRILGPEILPVALESGGA